MTQLEELDKDLTDSEFYETCNIMGKKWVILILIAIYKNAHTFSEIMKVIPKINTGILTNRLNELVDKLYITKTQNAKYNLSEKWKDLIEWLKSLRDWAIQTGRDKKIKKQ